MIAPVHVFLDGELDCHTYSTLKQGLGSLAVGFIAGGIALHLFISSADQRDPPIAGPIALVVGICACVIGFSCLWQYFRGEIIRLQVSEDGVRYGNEFWTWASVAAIRCKESPWGLQVFIWKTRDRGPGRILQVDDPPDPLQWSQITSELKALFAARGLDITCE